MDGPNQEILLPGLDQRRRDEEMVADGFLGIPQPMPETFGAGLEAHMGMADGAFPLDMSSNGNLMWENEQNAQPFRPND
ncbi:hypothetical protein LTR37_020287, partial [Vermiconidia calcicola]